MPGRKPAAHLPAGGISKASFRKKERSHKNRVKKRREEAHEMGYAPRRESIKRALHKHVAPSDPVKSKLSIKKTNMASTGYIGRREQRSGKVYPLEDLVGENSIFRFLLIHWDGVYVALASLFATDSAFCQNAHAHPG
jgi:hypothetical protein